MDYKVGDGRSLTASGEVHQYMIPGDGGAARQATGGPGTNSGHPGLIP